MKIRKMSHYEIFKQDKRKCGFLYAALWLFDLPYLFDNSGCRLLKHISDTVFDWCDRRYRKCCMPVGKKLCPAGYIIFEPIPKLSVSDQSYETQKGCFDLENHISVSSGPVSL